jgi:hypothetical protein
MAESSAPTLCRSDTYSNRTEVELGCFSRGGVELLGGMVDVCYSFALIYLLVFQFVSY